MVGLKSLSTFFALILCLIMITGSVRVFAQYDDEPDDGYNYGYDPNYPYDNSGPDDSAPVYSDPSKYPPASDQNNSNSDRLNSKSGDTGFGKSADKVHFQIVEGDFWHKDKCRICDRRGIPMTKTVAQTSKRAAKPRLMNRQLKPRPPIHKKTRRRI